MTIDDAQKQSILDVISLLKKSFDIKDDDAVVISRGFSERQQEINRKLEDLQKNEQDFKRKTSKEIQFIRQQRNKIRKQELDIRTQSVDLARKVEALNVQGKSIDQRMQTAKTLEQSVQEREQQLIQQLGQLSGLSRDDVMNLLCKKLESTAKLKSENKIKEIINETSLRARIEATKILAYAVQKESQSVVSEIATCAVDLPDESLKGKIIGREGRNIRTFEELTGVTVLVDDTPEMIVLSCYEPVRREIAKLAMTKLISDGRIHPQRIEEIVESTKREIDDIILNTGRQIVADLQITDMHTDIIKAIGKLKYRTSYSQNVLEHSFETALIAADIAAELKLDKKLASRAGLLHDIGKSIIRAVSGSHAELGADFAKQCGESDVICKIIAEHHDDNPSSVYTWLVRAADTLSSARPGVRHDTFDAYVKRLDSLEKIALSFDGVKSCYALLAGRELRIVVEPDEVSDDDAEVMAEKIKNEIEKSMNYPGQIKIMVIREKRHIKLAT